MAYLWWGNTGQEIDKLNASCSVANLEQGRERGKGLPREIERVDHRALFFAQRGRSFVACGIELSLHNFQPASCVPDERHVGGRAWRWSWNGGAYCGFLDVL